MADNILHNWEKKTKEHQKQYRQFLKRTDKNKILKQLPALHEEAFEKLTASHAPIAAKIIHPASKHLI